MRILTLSLCLMTTAAGPSLFSQTPPVGKLSNSLTSSPRKAAVETNATHGRVTLPFDQNWRFLKSDAEGAEQPGFDDSGWRLLDLPHDWSIEGPFAQDAPSGKAGAFLPNGIGWYRKTFSLPENAKQEQIYAEFDGVMANSDVWINGFHLGKRPYGYSSFRYDLTGHLNFGDQKNVIAVRADNSRQPASRWYSGAGIYRHVRLVMTSPIHLDQWGVTVTTSLVDSKHASVSIRSSLLNKSDHPERVTVTVSLSDPENHPLAKTESPLSLPAGGDSSLVQTLKVQSPRLWSPEHPNLYLATVTISSGDRELDGEKVPFGIREFHFDADTGFWLNGQNFKIKGVCLHVDGSAFGTAVPLGVWERRLKALRELGVNAIRTAHNPPAPEFLDLCDRMGFLVMDETFDCWTVGKNPYDYHLDFNDWSGTDAADMVRRDRNHPSIILYSAGNEIHDTPNAPLAKEILGKLVDVFHREDPTRPVTQALFRPNRSQDYSNGLADMLDVVGQNYREREILAAHAAKPSRKIIGTENGHDRTVWLALRDNPAYAGQFLWTGVDYLGEARNWPAVANSSGLLDRTGTPRPMAFQRASWWSDKPMVKIARRTAPDIETVIDPGYDAPPPDTHDKHAQRTFADWTPRSPNPNGEVVEAYSNCEEVELFLNGKSLGTQSLPQDASPRSWKVNFEAGTLRAVAKNKGTVVASDELKTAGEPSRILLSADPETLGNTWDDISYVQAVITDDHGIPVPDASTEITFAIDGPGTIAALDSGDNTSHEPFQATKRKSWMGRCFAIIRGKQTDGAVADKITVTASAPGLASAMLTLRSNVSKIPSASLPKTAN